MTDKCLMGSVLWQMGGAMAVTVILAGTAAYIFTGQWTATIICFVSAGILSGWTALFVRQINKKLALFSEELCMHIDMMMDGKGEMQCIYDEDTLLDRIVFRLNRLYRSLQAAKEQSRTERSDLQSLISDVSHQVKTPATNLKLAASALLEQELPRADQVEYLHILTSQVEKLDFLMAAMVKSSRLETGVITLVKKPGLLFETLAAAMGSIFSHAQEKQMNITVNCPETLQICHDCRWTEEALFNILDNAVKYTPSGGSITVSAFQWEAYTRIDIADNGRGIQECRQASVFARFYREPEVHEVEGIGIGLYLSREIIAKQGGYIALDSKSGEGSTFSIFLPNFP